MTTELEAWQQKWIKRLHGLSGKALEDMEQALFEELAGTATTTPVDPQNGANLQSHALDHTLANSWHAEHERRIDVEYENARLRAELAGLGTGLRGLIEYTNRKEYEIDISSLAVGIAYLRGYASGTLKEIARQIAALRADIERCLTDKQPCEGCINGS